MKIADLIDALMGAESSLRIPLPRVSTTVQAEQTQRYVSENLPRFVFDLVIDGGRWYLVVSRRPGSQVPYDA